MSGESAATQAPTQSARVETSRSMPSRANPALPVERQVIAVLGMEDHRQQPGAGPAAGDGMERRRRLGDLLARPAGELLTDGLDHLPLPGDHLQRLGDVLAQLDQLALAARADRGRRNDDALARQMPATAPALACGG